MGIGPLSYVSESYSSFAWSDKIPDIEESKVLDLKNIEFICEYKSLNDLVSIQ